VVIGFNLALALAMWVITKKYTVSLMQEAAERRQVPEVGPLGAH
jgi:hypothetical protein